MRNSGEEDEAEWEGAPLGWGWKIVIGCAEGEEEEEWEEEIAFVK